MGSHRNASAVHTRMGNDLGSHFSDHSNGSCETLDLKAMVEDCNKLILEIEKTSKEVGGDPWKSARYQEAKEIKSIIRNLEQLGNGYYTYTRSSDKG